MSINYYNNNAKAFIERTEPLDMSFAYRTFVDLLSEDAIILDAGCGSGRDAAHFMKMGYEVRAFDGSDALVQHVAKKLGDRVSVATFESFASDIKYDGIWASASLLHVPEGDMVRIVRKFRDMLKEGGIFYMSFKKRPENFEKEGRSFTCYEEEELCHMIGEVGDLEILQLQQTDSVQGNVDELWMSAYCRYQKDLDSSLRSE